MRSSLLVPLFVALMALLHGATLKAQDRFEDLSATDTLSALVFYGEDRLLAAENMMSDTDLDQLLDSLCTLDPAPLALIEDLLLFKRIRNMDEADMVQLIDSLFDLETVPYALINEINLYASDMPSQISVDEGFHVDWYCDSHTPGTHLYGDWRTDAPNVYGPELSAQDSVLLIKLTDDDLQCGFRMPVPGVLTSRFGHRNGRAHNGIDLNLRTGEPVRSLFPGVVRFAGAYGSYGRLVVVRHWNGLESYYAHLHRTKVSVGQELDAGEVLGLGGSTGRSTGPHLHLEVRFKGIPIDPTRFIDLSLGELTCGTLVLKRTRWSYAAYPFGTRFHTVQKGEHLYGIAERYGTSINDLCILNGITRKTTLRVGQELMVSSEPEAFSVD